MSTLSPESIETLFDQYFNQTLTPDGLAQLEHWILEDAAHADAFAKAGLTHGLTREVMLQRLQQLKGRKKPLRFSPWALVAASLAVGVVGLALLVPVLGVAKRSVPVPLAEISATNQSPLVVPGIRNGFIATERNRVTLKSDQLVAGISKGIAGEGLINGRDQDGDAIAWTAKGGKFTEESAAHSHPAIIRTASLRLRTTDAHATAKQVEALAATLGGFVSSNQIQGEARQAATAQVEIRIPADSLDQARAKIRAMGLGVLADSTSATEVSSQLVDLAARIENLETAEKELRQIVARMGEKTNNTGELMTAYRELTGVREQIEVLRAQEKNFKDRVALSSLTVEIFENPPPPSAPEGWSASAPFQSSWVVLVNLGQSLWALAAYLLVVVLPMLLLFGVPAWVVYRVVRKRMK